MVSSICFVHDCHRCCEQDQRTQMQMMEVELLQKFKKKKKFVCLQVYRLLGRQAMQVRGFHVTSLCWH